jgi:uncharacterized membrane protein YeaQ/YmgE (transglycosylase-associated protein family)
LQRRLGVGTVTDAQRQTPSRPRRCEWALIFLPPYKDCQHHGYALQIRAVLTLLRRSHRKEQRYLNSTSLHSRVGIISWIVVGLIAGALAKLVLPGDDPGGIIVTAIIGMVGAVVGGFVFGIFGGTGATGFNVWSIVVATVGAIVLLLIYRLIAETLT